LKRRHVRYAHVPNDRSGDGGCGAGEAQYLVINRRNQTRKP
jgi:hypothetical protein